MNAILKIGAVDVGFCGGVWDDEIRAAWSLVIQQKNIEPTISFDPNDE